MGDIKEAVKNVAPDFQHLPPAGCLRAMTDLLGRCEEELDNPDARKAILQLCIAIAAPRVAELRQLQTPLLDLVRAAGSAPKVERCADGPPRKERRENAEHERAENAVYQADLHGFFFKLLKKETKTQRLWKPQAMVPTLQYVLRWMVAADINGALAAEGDGNLGFESVGAALAALYGEMGRCEKWSGRWQVKAVRALQKVLHACPQVLDHAVEFMGKKEPPALLVAAVANECAQTPGSKHQGPLLELYVKYVLEAKKPFSDYGLQAWAAVIATATKADFEEKFLPMIVRMLKRNPLAISSTVPIMLSQVSIDISSFAKEVLDPLAVDCLKAEDRREKGRALVRGFAAKCLEPSALLAVCQAWAACCVNKASKNDEKQASLMALAAAVDGISQANVEGILSKLAEAKGGIATALVGDANEDNRFLACKTAGKILLRLPNAEPLAQEMVKVLGDKKTPDRIRLAVLEALDAAAEGVTSAWGLAALEKCVPVLALAATKPVQRFQSLLGWALCSRIAAHDPEKLGSQLKKEQTGVLKDGTSFLNAPSSILKALASETTAQARLWRAVLSGHVSGGPSPAAAAKALLAPGAVSCLPPTPFSDALPLCRTTVMLLAALRGRGAPPTVQGETLPSPSMRLGLVEALAKADGETAAALPLLMAQALVAWLSELSALPPAQRQANGAMLRGVLLDLCSAAASRSESAQPETLALLILAAHHPIISTRKWPARKLWLWLRTSGPLAASLQSAPSSLWRLLREFLGSGLRLPVRDNTGFRVASIALASSFDLKTAPSGHEEALRQEIAAAFAACAEALHSGEVAKESEENVNIFFGQEGRLWVPEGTYVAEEREDKNVKVNKFLKGMYGDDDLDLIADSNRAKPKAAAAKAKGKAGAAAPKKSAKAAEATKTAADIEQDNIAEQAVIRARIRNYVDEASFALDVLEALASSDANAPVLESEVASLVPHLIILLKSPLTTIRARRSVRALTRLVVPANLVIRRDLLPDALLVVSKVWQLRPPKAAGTPGDEPACETVLASVSTGEALPPAALSLVLPVILKTLFISGPPLADVCAKAMQVLEKQLRLGAEIPEGMVQDVLDSFGVTLLSLKEHRHKTHSALLAIGRHLVSKEEHLRRLAEMFFAEDEAVRVVVIAALAEVQHNQLIEAFFDDNAGEDDDCLDPAPLKAVLTLGVLGEKTKEQAGEALEALCLEPDEDLLFELIKFANQKTDISEEVQILISQAVAGTLVQLEDSAMTTSALDTLMQHFREDAASRQAVARCLEQVFKQCLDGEEQVIRAFRFLLRQALGITSAGTPEAVKLREILLAAGIALVDAHGAGHAQELLRGIEEFEDSGAASAAGESARLGVAVFLGAISKHLGAGHPKMPEILPRLKERLMEPSSSFSVQDAITEVMPPLMKKDNKEQATAILEELLGIALAPKTDPVVRRGAAMGLGASVKGLTIQAFKDHDILVKIEAAAENKKDAGVREGALLCLEGLTINLKRLFDPYIVKTLPLLLSAFSDQSQQVQKASKMAAAAMMKQLSGPGVKMVLKPLLEGIKDKMWRTKLGSIEVLSEVCSCLPKQLATCLPQVVPALCGVINDQHDKVKAAARIALDRIGGIITSPELRALAPELIHALTDGAQFEHITKGVLDQLLGTSFVHHIDAPSLSLVCPLVQRALKERSAEMKRKGAQIVGSMVLLIKDPKDIQPYLPLLLPQLKVTLVDPIPDVRATAAKAFGTLANGLPEDMLDGVLPWLFNMLRSEESAVERSGAAHGLSEVLMAMGTERIEMLLPDILSNASNQDAPPNVKEGYLGLFVYLPVAMGASFEPHISNVLEALLKGVADENSSVRETAFKAAQVLTKNFGASYTALLLPPMEDGVFDNDWRIRMSSIQLMGQLIEQILRAHRIPTTSCELMFAEVLPREWRAHMLVSLYIVRSDESPVVRTECAKCWKAFVQNTPRTLKELLPTLMSRLILNLASTNREKQRVAARCVGDLVAKLGERVMPELMPIFMKTLSTGDAHVREGVCIGLAELINSTTKQLLADYLGELIPAIRQAIIDDSESVRNSASQVVSLLHGAVGPRATTDVVTWVLAQLQEEETEEFSHLYVHGLEQLIAKQHREVLPIVLDRLTKEPENGWTVGQITGMASIAVVPDSHTVHRHLSDVLPVLISIIGDNEADSEVSQAALASADRVMERVERAGLELLFEDLVKAVENTENAKIRAAGATLFEHFFDNTQLDVVPVLPIALRAILPPALGDEDDDALAAGMQALKAIMTKCKTLPFAPYLAEVRETVLTLVKDPETGREDPTKLLPGLCKQKGLEHLFPIYQQGLLNGDADMRELAAKGVGELVTHCTEAALKPYVVKITGPLIRIVGDRFPGSVKKAIVDTLMCLMLKGGATLRPFLPQLQQTYLKCLADPSDAVRQKAGESLGTLVRLAPKTEPLVNDLVGALGTEVDPAVRLAKSVALGEVLLNVPTAVGEATQDKLVEALVPRAFAPDDGPGRQQEVAAWCLALAMRRHLPEDRALSIFAEELEPAFDDDEGRVGAAIVLAGICWRQMPNLPETSAGLLEVARPLADNWLPKLLIDIEPSVQVAGCALFAALARCCAGSGDADGTLTPAGERVASLVSAPKPPAPEVVAAGVLAARHYGMAGGGAATAVLASACAVRGASVQTTDAAQDAERSLAALLGKGSARGEAEAAAAVKALTGKLDDKSKKALVEFTAKRLRLLSARASEEEFKWDF